MYFGTSKARKLSTKYLSHSLSGAASQDAALQQHTKYTCNESSSRNSKPLERLRCHLRMPGEVLHDASFKSGTASISASYSVAASGGLAGTHFGSRCQYFCPPFFFGLFLILFVSMFPASCAAASGRSAGMRFGHRCQHLGLGLLALLVQKCKYCAAASGGIG